MRAGLKRKLPGHIALPALRAGGAARREYAHGRIPGLSTEQVREDAMAELESDFYA